MWQEKTTSKNQSIPVHNFKKLNSKEHQIFMKNYSIELNAYEWNIL